MDMNEDYITQYYANGYFVNGNFVNEKLVSTMDTKSISALLFIDNILEKTHKVVDSSLIEKEGLLDTVKKLESQGLLLHGDFYDGKKIHKSYLFTTAGTMFLEGYVKMNPELISKSYKIN